MRVLRDAGAAVALLGGRGRALVERNGGMVLYKTPFGVPGAPRSSTSSETLSRPGFCIYTLCALHAWSVFRVAHDVCKRSALNYRTGVPCVLFWTFPKRAAVFFLPGADLAPDFCVRVFRLKRLGSSTTPIRVPSASLAGSCGPGEGVSPCAFATPWLGGRCPLRSRIFGCVCTRTVGQVSGREQPAGCTCESPLHAIHYEFGGTIKVLAKIKRKNALE